MSPRDRSAPPLPRPETGPAAEPSYLLENVLLFGRLLRGAGLPLSLGQTLGLARALGWIDVGDRQQVFHAARALLVMRREDLALFKLLFDRFWNRPGGRQGARQAPRAPRHDPRRESRLGIASYLAQKADPADPEVEVGERSATYSRHELLQHKDFSRMTAQELATVRRLIRETHWKVSLRETRRQVPSDRGPRLDLRRVLREAAKYGGSPLRLARLSRKIKQRPIVLLADVSGSMEKYSRLILLFFYSLTHSLRDVECFVFGTRLSRITTQLRLRNIDRALDEAAREVVDWGGGTRIGESLHAFNRRWARRVLRRGAVVLVVSDGWERGDVGLLTRELRHLRHRCHRLIWLNPHLGQRGYEPLVEGMAAALPLLDDFLPVHNLQSLRGLSTKLAELPARRGGGPERRSSTLGGTV